MFLVETGGSAAPAYRVGKVDGMVETGERQTPSYRPFGLPVAALRERHSLLIHFTIDLPSGEVHLGQGAFVAKSKPKAETRR